MKLSKFSKTFLVTTSFVAFSMFFLSCNEKKQAEVEVELPQESPDHQWYFFNNGSYSEIDLPQHSPILSLKPWTESVRICDANISSDGKGFVLVNRLGVMIFDRSEAPVLVQDFQLFSSFTAENLVFEGSTPFFTLAKNSFFNKNAASSNAKDNSHIIKLSEENKMFYPVVTYGDLKIEENAEVSGTSFDGKNWLTSIKSTAAGKTSFRYIKWNAIGELSALPPFTQPGKVMIRESSEKEYRNENSPVDFSKAPGRLKSLLADLPDSFDYVLTCKNAAGFSPRYFFKGAADGSESASAIISDGWVCAVFGDGTAYFCGGLDGKALINNGKTVAFRLPKLPESYCYGDFVISGDYFVIGWEETDFYKTGRSGFLTVDMNKIFYEK